MCVSTQTNWRYSVINFYSIVIGGLIMDYRLSNFSGANYLVAGVLPKLFRYMWLSFAACMIFFSATASAAYQYEYTGNPFTTIFNSHILLPDPPYVWEVSLPQQEYISVVFTSNTLLTTSSTFSDITGFSITAVNPDNTRKLLYPSPFPTDPSGHVPGMGDMVYNGVFTISSVDANGLPTGWNISIDHNYHAPTGRFTQTFIQTSTNQELTFGGYEGFTDYHGELNNNPGTWRVASVVPEPETYSMLLSGLGLIVYAARRKKRS